MISPGKGFPLPGLALPMVFPLDSPEFPAMRRSGHAPAGQGAKTPDRIPGDPTTFHIGQGTASPDRSTGAGLRTKVPAGAQGSGSPADLP